MDPVELNAAERLAFQQIATQLPDGAAYRLSATRFTPTHGSVAEIVEVTGAVQGRYARQQGQWVQSFEDDVRKGLYDPSTYP